MREFEFLINGFKVFDVDPYVNEWVNSARRVVETLDVSLRRHGRTWFVGVDALPNNTDGSIRGATLGGAWMDDLSAHPEFDGWHKAQVSIVYDGYPRQDPDESDAAHRFRVKRDAAHMDGLLPEGANRRRHLREPHAFIVGLPLNDVLSSPLVVWPDSHLVMGRAFSKVFEGVEPRSWGDQDVTDVYQTARREVFETCKRVEVSMRPGQVVLLHRHLIHGVAPWEGPDVIEGRQVAYFRPMVANVADWL